MLSPKKQRFVDFIRDFTDMNNRPPTFVEIMGGLSIRSLGTVNWYVNELEREGVIKRMRGKNGKRALSVLEEHIHNRLPLLGLIAAGHPLEVFEDSEYMAVPPQYIKPENYVLKVNGNSMIDDQIKDGDYVIVQKTETAANGDTVVALVNHEATLKRYYLRDKGVELHPQNPDFDIIHVQPEDEFQINGIVLAVFREYSKN
ncbi:MAG: transcriptional repressor LexA [Candidatus Marinimicrobia bacterium]|jgi:repressor LexA|nr:transcriptional repressor LexA [Candidatus Neomarinimicrobiota bacterium]MDP6937043.1 transcriptional repressor LexA [Candidatus Neomarinimicrobiota bacterium]